MAETSSSEYRSLVSSDRFGTAVASMTTSHPAGELRDADVVVASLADAQPELLRWVSRAAAPSG